MNQKISFLIFILILNIGLFLQSCSENDDELKELIFTLPEGWQVFEDFNVNDQHRKINIATNLGSIVAMELLQGEGANQFTSNTYFKRYMDSALPTEEIKAKAVIDLGEVERAGKTGYFAKVSVPPPTDVEFVIELYQYASEGKNLFVVFNMPPEVLQTLQPELDEFVRSIKL